MTFQWSELTSDDLPELQPETTRTQRDINWIIRYLRQLSAGDGSGGGHVILDDGVELAQQPNLDFVGDGVRAMDYPGTNTTRVEIDGLWGSPGPDIRIINKSIQRAGNGVLLFSGGQELLREYATITEALGDAVSGDIVELPAGTYTEDVTVPAGVTLRGRGWSSIINGMVTLNGAIEQCAVEQNVDTGTDVVGVIADAGALLNHVRIHILQDGAGKALGLLGIAGEEEASANAYDCEIVVMNSGGASGWGYAGVAAGSVLVHQGAVQGIMVEA